MCNLCSSNLAHCPITDGSTDALFWLCRGRTYDIGFFSVALLCYNRYYCENLNDTLATSRAENTG